MDQIYDKNPQEMTEEEFNENKKNKAEQIKQLKNSIN